MTPPLCAIIGAGAKSPLGLTLLEVAMCVRAAKVTPRSTTFTDKRHNLIGDVRCPSLSDDLHGYPRLLALAVPALKEAAAGVPGPYPLILALPEVGRADDDPRLGGEILAELARLSELPIDLPRSLVVRAGHAGGGMAIEAALLRLRGTGAGERPPAVLVGGVDSHHHPGVLFALDEECRLHSIATEDGLVPSEGAAFLALALPEGPAAPGDRKERRLPPSLGSIVAIGSAMEETFGTEEPNLGVAMTRLVRSVASATGEPPIAWVLSDVNGEQHRNREWSRVSIRNNDWLPETTLHQMLVEEMGDSGAASGPLLAAIACTFFRTGAAPATRVMIALHSEGAERAAFVLDTAEVAERGGEALPLDFQAPARKDAPLQKEALDRVLLAMRDLPATVTRAPIKAALDEALIALGRWAESELLDEAHLGLLDQCIVRAQEARLAFAGNGAPEESAQAIKTLEHVEAALRESRERTIDRLVALQGRRAPEIAASALPASSFRASVGVPVLHAVARSPLLPLVNVSARPAEDDDEGESDNEAPRLPGGESPAAHHRRKLARDCMEDLAIFGSLRRTHPDEPWSNAARFEQRLLNATDALAALAISEPGERGGSGVVAQLLSYATETAFADSGRAFAGAFLLANLDGDDAARALLLAVRQSHPLTRAAQEDALCLGSSTALLGALERWIWDGDPVFSRLALSVLRFRRAVKPALLLPLLTHPDPVVLEAVVRALGASPPEQRAEVSAALIELAQESPAERVLVALAESLILLASPSGVALAATGLATALDRPTTLSHGARLALLRLLCLAGGPAHAALILRCLQAFRAPEAVEAVGWFGHAGMVEPLLAELASENEARERALGAPWPYEIAAARALVRITGAYLEDAEDAFGLGLSVSAAAWKSHWDERRVDFGGDCKYRFGQPYHPMATLDELAERDSTSLARSYASLELAALAIPGMTIEPGDWVARQRSEIEAARERFAKGEIACEAGQWTSQILALRGR
jgi:3-oxoacyl-[acyl-carrier-protein] synthase-1